MSHVKRNLLGALGVAAVAAVLVVPAAKSAHEVVIKNGAFSPSEEFVGQGDTVTWVHDDAGQPHSVTADDGSFDSSPDCSATATDACLQAGEVFEHKFTETGRFPYHSKVSGGPDGEGTAGTIVVVEKGAGVSTSSTTG